MAHSYVNGTLNSLAHARTNVVGAACLARVDGLKNEAHFVLRHTDTVKSRNMVVRCARVNGDCRVAKL